MPLTDFIQAHVNAVISGDFPTALLDYDENSTVEVISNRHLDTSALGLSYPENGGPCFYAHFRGPAEIGASYGLVYGWANDQLGGLKPENIAADLKFDESQGIATMAVTAHDNAGEPVLQVFEWFRVRDQLIVAQGVALCDRRKAMASSP